MAFDATQYKTSTRQQWQDYASGWNDWAPLLETWLGDATERMLELAGIEAGSNVLDVAAGAGGQSIAATRRVGPSGTVLATDLSPAILQHAQQAAIAAGLDNLTTRELDGEELRRLTAGSFDAAISRVGLIYFPNRQRALTGIHHALRDGGRFATVTYSTAATNGFFSLPVSIIRERAELPPPAGGQPGPFSLADPEVVERDLTEAGFHDVVVEIVDAPVRLPSAAECVRFERESFGALHQMLATLTTDEQHVVWKEIEDALSQYENADGFVGPCELVIAGATRSSARREFRVAAVQVAPAYLDREATLDIVADHIAKAGADDADLVVFPESFVPGYPDFVWRHKPFADADWFARFHDQAVDVGGAALDTARDAAAAAAVWVALGVTERGSTGTLYNTVVYIDDTGEIAARHRKLVPTGAERLVWANGQGPMLTVVDIGGVKVGSLICWEMYMPLARAAMYQQGIDVLLAPTWDNSDEWVPTLQHTAKEGQVFVVGVTAHLRGCDVPHDLPGADDIYGGADDFMSRGNTTIVAPGGAILQGPLVAVAGTVTATLDLDRIAAGRRFFDPVGHYARPDVLTLAINTPGDPT